MRSLLLHYALPAALLLSLYSSPLAAQTSTPEDVARQQRHNDPIWEQLSRHMPDPATATSEQLESEGDLLRARRFPEDAIDMYRAAIQRGDHSADLINKIGLTELELRNIALSEQYFRQAVKLDRHSPQSWNNLAAAEYLEHNYSAAINDYKRAIKLDKKSAVYHVNLSTAYFELKDYRNSRKQSALAMRMDPHVYEHSNGIGITAHVLSVQDKARFDYEMAKLYAQQKNEEMMLHSLARASEGGFDILQAMTKDPDLAKYRTDPRVLELVVTANSLREQKTHPAVSTASLGMAKAPTVNTPQR